MSHDYLKMKKLAEIFQWSATAARCTESPENALLTPPSSPELVPESSNGTFVQTQHAGKHHHHSSNGNPNYDVVMSDNEDAPIRLHSPTSSTSSGTGSHTTTDAAFDKMLQGPPTGRLSVTIVAGRQLHISSVQSKPYCVVEFERNEFVTRTPMREALHQRSNKPLDFLDLVRAASSPTWDHTVTFDVARLNGEVQVSVYERVPDQVENFLGYLTIEPPRTHNEVIDGWYKLNARGKTPVTGEMHVRISYEAVEKAHLTPDSFEVLKLIGKGNFGKVFQVRKKDTGRIYAMKVLHKQDLIERREVEHTLAEKNILIRAEASPFLVGLKFSFQTRTHLYLVTDFMNGGELFWHLQNEVRLSEERAKYYAAEIVLALEHLHKHNIVYRDLKPENILLDATGHIALCDFGLCKENLGAGQTTNTFCGTSEYLAPEVLAECGYGKSVDWWSLGILFYEMIAGFSPFYTHDTQLMYRRILFGKLKFPKGLFSEEAKSLIKGLLARNPAHRLGTHHDAQEIKNHPFFALIDWEALAKKQFTNPPFKPNVTSEDDTSCFDPAFTEEEAVIDWPTVNKTLSRQSLTDALQREFKGFTYSGESAPPTHANMPCGSETTVNPGDWPKREDVVGC